MSRWDLAGQAAGYFVFSAVLSLGARAWYRHVPRLVDRIGERMPQSARTRRGRAGSGSWDLRVRGPQLGGLAALTVGSISCLVMGFATLARM